MTDSITVTGVVGSDPRLHITEQGLAITSFRLASTRRYFDRAKGTWEDGETNWYGVSGFRQLAHNTIASVHKGERVIVRGRLRLRAWESGEKSGKEIEIDAEAIGHDLAWGTTELTKVRITRDGAASAGSATAAVVGDGATGAASGWPGVEPEQAVEHAFGSGFAPLDDSSTDSDDHLEQELV